MYDLDWQSSGYSLPQMKHIVQSSDILIARSETHISPIYNFFGRKPDNIINNFNLERFKNDYYFSEHSR